MRAESYRPRLQEASRAEKYATRFERGARRRIDQREQRSVRNIFASLDGCESVLDVPSGAGRFLASLNERPRRVIEADVALEILEFARARGKKQGLNAGYVQADALRLPLRDGAVDCVFCNRLLHHIVSVEERAVFLREMRRVSRRYVVVSFFDYQKFGRVRRLLKKLKGRKPKYDGQPTLVQFQEEATRCGFQVRDVVPTGAVWVAQKYFVLEKGGAQ